MLRVRTGYSFRRAVGFVEEVVDRLWELGWHDAPITDTSTYGFLRWHKACKARSMRPIYGMEVLVVADPDAKRPAGDHFAFLAKNNLRDINKLIETSTMQFRYVPLLYQEQALEAPGVFKIMGHRAPAGIIPPQEDLYLALSPATPMGQLWRAMKQGHPIAASFDNYFTREGDVGFYETLCGMSASTQSYAQHILSEEEWRAAVAHHGLTPKQLQAALDNSASILEQCQVDLGDYKAKLPNPPRPGTLREMCEWGAVKLGVDLTNPIYNDRLNHEIKLIEAKNFEEYFYIVGDLVKWARARMSVGPARGSSCGSLLCYLLEITTVDPIPHGLIFERFIDITRMDYPDIDIDFSDQQRSLAIDYLRDTYGAENFARIGTVAFYHPRSALQEVGAALRLPRWKCDAVAESLIQRSSGDSRALNTLEDTLRNMEAGKTLLADHPEALIAARFEGHPRHSSQHAAGVVISSRPISDFVAIDRRTDATHCDWRDAEAGYNLLKIDMLGLTQLSVFEDCLALAGLPKDFLEKLPLDDQGAFDVINKKQWAGIFQFNGRALQSVASQIVTDCFNDFAAITALARPGPLASGSTTKWVERRKGDAPVAYLHEFLKPFLEDTLGVPIYQEQIMNACRWGGLSWEDVSMLRKAMSKGYGKEYFDNYGGPWKAGAIERGLDPELAQTIWDSLCAYGSMGFNKAHAVAYGLISYWCCWLKAHHPVEFAAATLSHEGNPMRQIELLRELNAEGVDYIPVDPEISGLKWTVTTRNGKRLLVGPLTGVKGLGPKTCAAVLGSRNRGEPMPERARKLLENPKTEIESLWPIRDAFQRELPDPLARHIISTPTPIFKVEEEGIYTVFCIVTKINPRDENEAILVARRGGTVIDDGLTNSLLMNLQDDTGMLLAKINRFRFREIGRPIIDRGNPGKHLYVFKGKVMPGFRMLHVSATRHIGEL